MTERTRRIIRLALGVVIPHTAVVLVQRRRARRHRTALVQRPPSEPHKARPFDYEAAIALLVERGLEEDVARLGAIPRRTMSFVEEAIAREAPARPLRVLHVGNFLGVSLAALSDIVIRHHAQSTIVSIDPNLTHLEVEDPQRHVMALLDEFGLQRNNLVICGYSLDGSADGAAGENALISLERIGQRFDVVLLDGNHVAAYVRSELEVIVRLLEDDGLLLMDDVSHAYPEIRAVFDTIVDDDSWPLEKLGRDQRLGVLRRTAR